MVRIFYTYCKTCGSKIKTLKESQTHGKKRSYITTSEQGVLFRDEKSGTSGTWFCNDCWEKMLESKEHISEVADGK